MYASKASLLAGLDIPIISPPHALLHVHSDQLAFFCRTLGTGLGSKYKPYWNYICGHVLNKYSRRGS